MSSNCYWSTILTLTNDREADDGGEPGVGVDLALVLPGVQLGHVPDLELPGLTSGRDRHLQPGVWAEDEAADREDGHVGEPQPGHEVVAGEARQGALEEGGAVLHHHHLPGPGQELGQVGLLQAGGRPEHGEVGRGGGRDGEGQHLSHYGQRLEAQQDQQAGGHHGLTSLITMTDGEVTPACPVCLGLSLIIIVTSQCPWHFLSLFVT